MNEREILDRAKRAAMNVDGPHEPYEALFRRRDRKRRNQRIAAGLVGIAVFVAAIWIVTTGGPFDRTADDGQQPGTSGATTPSVTPTPTDAPAVEPHPAPSAGGSLSTAPWVEASAIPDVDYVVDLNTGAMTPLPEPIFQSTLGKTNEVVAAQTHYAVSPDGAQLAYVGTSGEGTPQIFVAGIDGLTGIRQVTNDPVGADWPAWSPDGTKIGYEGGSLPHRDLFVVDVATGAVAHHASFQSRQPTQIADGVVLPGEGLQFAPDGSSLVYTGFPDGAAEMRTVPVGGGQSTILFGGGYRGIGDAGQGSLSPDGSLVTFMGHEVGGPGPLRFVVNTDGTALRVIRGHHSNPAGVWSPDGGRIVALNPDASQGGIAVIDVVTGDALQVAEGREAIWLDDHTLLIEV
jgi:Tol biopolymer transport system component